MNHKLFGGKAYSSLIRALFFQTLATLGASGLLVLLLRALLRGKLANHLVVLICRFYGTDWDTGLDLYQLYIRNNFDKIILAGILIIFFLLFRVSLSRFTRYFDQIVTGIDQLTSEADTPIIMSPKLRFIETALNESKQKLKSRKQDALDAEQRKNEMIVYLAHDIKTPLTSVIGYLSLLEEAPDMAEAQKRKYTHIALEKADRLEALINEFFEITRYHVKDVPLKKSSLDLRFMLEQIADELYPQLAAHGNEVRLSIEEEITLCCDADKMARALNNLLKNAVSYSYPGTPISITCKKRGGTVSISFQNEGQTIPSEKLSAIFEKFYRLDAARATQTGGAGLGLAIAKEIVTLHGGTITARSRDDTVVFQITLPAACSETNHTSFRFS